MKPTDEQIAEFKRLKEIERQTYKCPSCKNIMRQNDEYFKRIWSCSTPDCKIDSVVIQERSS
jgi:ribosomal protein L37AE/L43A